MRTIILLFFFFIKLNYLFGQCNFSVVLNTVDETCPGASDGYASVQVQAASNGGGTVSLLSYCSSNPSPNFSTQLSASIAEVELLGDNSDIINNTLGAQDFYEDYTTLMHADVTEGQTYTVYVTPHDEFPNSSPPNYVYAPESINVYIDFNIDGDFLDSGEDLGQINIPFGTWTPGTVYPFSFSVPSTGMFGATRMRVVCMSNAGWIPVSMGACESPIGWTSPLFGATEDYSIVINSSGSNCNYLWSNGMVTDSIYGLSSGTYSVSVTDISGCTVTETVVINTNSNNISVTASADQNICHGGIPSQLYSNANYTGNYNWSPSTNLVNANVPDPVFSSTMTTTTTFTVNFTDSNGCSVSDSLVITVNPVPNVVLSAVPNSACINDSIILFASISLPLNLYRFQYNVGNGWQNLITTNGGGWGNINPITFYNITTLTHFRVRVREDWGCTVSPWSSVVDVPINIVNTPLISHN